MPEVVAGERNQLNLLLCARPTTEATDCRSMDFQYLTLIVIGFAAQMVDGALGMAFGVIATSSLIATGVPPVTASAAIHAAEVATTAISGASHVWNGNVDRKLLLKLIATGVAGGIVGAYVLTGLPENVIKPIITVYLCAMSVLIFARGLGWKLDRLKPPIPIVGAGGGFLDAVGGGGWGPLVASTLMASGDNPRRTVGSVNLAEFFVTLVCRAMANSRSGSSSGERWQRRLPATSCAFFRHE